ncbi:hypothetical protein N0M98_24520 [Paenibacillus doosanensis]|nr:hypothetical protein [Paenibacillus doosanensis]
MVVVMPVGMIVVAGEHVAAAVMRRIPIVRTTTAVAPPISGACSGYQIK